MTSPTNPRDKLIEEKVNELETSFDWEAIFGKSRGVLNTVSDFLRAALSEAFEAGKNSDPWFSEADLEAAREDALSQFTADLRTKIEAMTSDLEEKNGAQNCNIRCHDSGKLDLAREVLSLLTTPEQKGEDPLDRAA